MTWDAFKTKFRKAHILPGLIKIMRDKFLNLKQGGMSVTEYLEKFSTWGRYVMSMHASVLVDSVGPPSAEVCRAAASFP
jgi:hypothetical protein